MAVAVVEFGLGAGILAVMRLWHWSFLVQAYLTRAEAAGFGARRPLLLAWFCGAAACLSQAVLGGFDGGGFGGIHF